MTRHSSCRAKRTGPATTERSDPPVLALGEKHRLSGKDVIMAINLGYDLSLAFLEGVTGAGMETKGWNGIPWSADHAARGGKDPRVDRGSDGERRGNCRKLSCGLRHPGHPAEEYTMTKNIRFPMMSYAAIMAAMLAGKGFTACSMIEGHDGFVHSIMDDEYDVERLLNSKKSSPFARPASNPSLRISLPRASDRDPHLARDRHQARASR